MKTETKVCKKCKETKSVDDFYKDKKTADKRRAECKKCSVASGMEWAKKNAEKANAYAAEWRKGHKESCDAATKKWRDNNSDKVKKSQKEYREKNLDVRNNNASEWKKRNPAKNSASVAQRNALKLQATPTWADQRLIQFKYDLAARMTKATGYQWDVDHIIPLRNKLVCGLHVENNLQVITHVANMKKGNRVQL